MIKIGEVETVIATQAVAEKMTTTAESGIMMVKDMMIRAANEGISSYGKIGLLGGFPRFSIIFYLAVRVRRATTSPFRFYSFLIIGKRLDINFDSGTFTAIPFCFIICHSIHPGSFTWVRSLLRLQGVQYKALFTGHMDD